jgi:hypothetical protein
MLLRTLAICLIVLTPLVAACGNGGLPAAPGRYTLKDKSVSFDGDRYSFFWADAAGELHHAQTSDVKLQLDDSSFLEVAPSKDAVLHLKQDEPVTVEGRDRQGDFGNFWYPFLIGSMLSRGGPVIVNQPLPGEYRQPVYRYPPTDAFDRGDTIAGNVTNNAPRPPDYNKLPATAGTVAGQNSGTGGGNAATNKSSASSTIGGQAGGTGSGSAAINKGGGFRSGDQGYDAKVSGGSKVITGGSRPSVGGGSGALGSKPSISTGRGSGGAPRISTVRRR